jgi:hypothetical protein
MPDTFENADASDNPQSDLQRRLQREVNEPIFSNYALARSVEARERVLRDMMKGFVGRSEEVVTAGDDQDDEEGESDIDAEREADKTELQAFTKVGSIAMKMADDAYRAALPPLAGEANIRNFVACITHGMVLGVFEPSEGSKLLYGAQVAAVAESRRFRPRPVV